MTATQHDPAATSAKSNPDLRPVDVEVEIEGGLAALNERAMALIRERPGLCLLAAAALGFIVGKLAARA